MCFKLAVLALAYLSGLTADPVEFKQQKRQVGNPGLSDLEPAESGYGNPHEAIQAGSKYFQYIEVPTKDHYEHGHKRGNDHHFIERHEEAHPHEGEFKNKVRWGDKHGGYGEHYWDYNHDGHHHDEDGGEETENKPQYAVKEQQSEEQSQNHPKYISYGIQASESILTPAYARVDNSQRAKRQGLLGDVEFINDKAKSLILDGNAQKHGGNYRRADDYRGKREHIINEEDLVFESDKGTFLDRKTGIEYELKPVYP